MLISHGPWSIPQAVLSDSRRFIAYSCTRLHIAQASGKHRYTERFARLALNASIRMSCGFLLAIERIGHCRFGPCSPARTIDSLCISRNSTFPFLLQQANFQCFGLGTPLQCASAAQIWSLHRAGPDLSHTDDFFAEASLGLAETGIASTALV